MNTPTVLLFISFNEMVSPLVFGKPVAQNINASHGEEFLP